jgi:hypothetical protein
MDALRELLGTDRADRLKAMLFGARSNLVRLAAGEGESGTAHVARPDNKPTAGWPPVPIEPLFGHPLEGEGQWRAPYIDWLAPLDGVLDEAAPYLVQTIVRPDRKLPFSEVRMMAIDMRQLELRIEAGFDEPRPTTGPRGRGRVPAAMLPRTVAAFNGAFQTRHGSYGMVVDRRVLIPPKAGAASIAIDAMGVARLGSWPDSEEIPEPIVSLRQNLDPLIDNGVVNPRGREQWGFPLYADSYLSERSALCRTESGHLIYGYGIELTAETLARGLQLAGCRYAVHLDMNPGHVGFVMLDATGERPKTHMMAREMSIAPQRFLKASPKDFFYLVRRNVVPRIGKLSWKAEDGAHPTPAWLPAVYRANTRELGADVTVRAFLAERLEWRIRAGSKEKAARTARGPLGLAEHAQAMVGIGLGVASRKKNRRGLVLQGVVSLPMRPALGALMADSDGALRLAVSVEGMAPAGDATELVLTAAAGELRSEARKRGALRRRAAACMTADGTLLVAEARFDSSKAVSQVLLELGCREVVALDRGRQVRSFVHRAGTDAAPRADYAETVLYGMNRAMPGRARPLELP